MTLNPGVSDAKPEDINRSAAAIIKLSKAHGYTVSAFVYDIYDVNRKGVVADDVTHVLAVTLVDNTDLAFHAIWRDGHFAYARPSNVNQYLFGAMNHTQLRAVITGDWRSYQRCPLCQRWNAPCHCEDEAA